MIKGLEHAAIASPDPERLAQWYADHLGFEINFRYNGNVFVRAQNRAMIEIIPSEGARATQTFKDPGLRHLAIDVDDFEADCQRLAAKGIQFLTPPANAGGNRLVFFSDCDGNFIHLVQRQQPLP